MALIYAHKHCEAIDQEAVQVLKSSLKEMRQTASGTALYYASLFLWLTGQQVKAKEYISRTLKASSSSREVPAPGRHLSAGWPQEPALPASEAWPVRSRAGRGQGHTAAWPHGAPCAVQALFLGPVLWLL